VRFKLGNCRGIGLIELVLGLFIVGAFSVSIYGVYIMGAGSFRRGHAQIEVQQSARLAVERIIRDLRGSTSIYAGRIARNYVSSTYDTYASTTGIFPSVPAQIVMRILAVNESGEALKTTSDIIVTFQSGSSTIPAGSYIWEIIAYELFQEGSDYVLKSTSFTAVQDSDPSVGLQPEEATWFYYPPNPNFRTLVLARNLEANGLVFDYHGAVAPFANAREITVTLKAKKSINIGGRNLTSSTELISTARIRNQ